MSRWVHFPLVLPLWEIVLYISLFLFVILCGTYNVLVASLAYDTEFNPAFKDGWFGLKQDTSNQEWQFYKLFFQHIIPWYLGHIILSQMIQYCAKPLIAGSTEKRLRFGHHGNKILFLYSLITVIYVSGIPATLLLLIQCLLVYASTTFRSRLLVWITNIAIIGSLTHQPLSSWQESLFLEKRDFLLYIFTSCMISHRYMSYCLEELDQSDKSIVNLFTYAFYLPLLYVGPVLTYDKYKEQLYSNGESTKSNTFYEIGRWVRLIFWSFITDLVPNFLYFTALHLDYNFLASSDLLTLMGLTFCQGLYFYMKYVTMFGIGRQIAVLDGFKTPETPRCVATIAYYSQMWKKFDRGLYEFLTRYIYIPLGGSRRGSVRQLIASMSCFIYIGYWHGSREYLYYWVFLNFLEVSVETVAANIFNHNFVQHVWCTLSLPFQRRLQALCTVPLLLISLLSIHAFFDGVEVFQLYVTRFIFHGDVITYAVTFLVLYCFVQTSLQADIWEAVVEGKVIFDRKPTISRTVFS